MAVRAYTASTAVCSACIVFCSNSAGGLGLVLNGLMTIRGAALAPPIGSGDFVAAIVTGAAAAAAAVETGEGLGFLVAGSETPTDAADDGVALAVGVLLAVALDEAAVADRAGEALGLRFSFSF